MVAVPVFVFYIVAIASVIMMVFFSVLLFYAVVFVRTATQMMEFVQDEWRRAKTNLIHMKERIEYFQAFLRIFW